MTWHGLIIIFKYYCLRANEKIFLPQEIEGEMEVPTDQEGYVREQPRFPQCLNAKQSFVNF